MKFLKVSVALMVAMALSSAALAQSASDGISDTQAQIATLIAQKQKQQEAVDAVSAALSKARTKRTVAIIILPIAIAATAVLALGTFGNMMSDATDTEATANRLGWATLGGTATTIGDSVYLYIAIKDIGKAKTRLEACSADLAQTAASLEKANTKLEVLKELQANGK